MTDPIARALADLQAYQRSLKYKGELLQARAVARCILLLRQQGEAGGGELSVTPHIFPKKARKPSI